jgi:hypothetical protein
MIMPSESLLFALALAGVATFALMFIWDYLREGEAEDAASATSQRLSGVLAGLVTVAIASFAEVVHVLFEFPGLIITMLGVGGIVAGWSWPLFAASAFTTLILGEAMKLR